jgi:hypothetical protein
MQKASLLATSSLQLSSKASLFQVPLYKYKLMSSPYAIYDNPNNWREPDRLERKLLRATTLRDFHGLLVTCLGFTFKNERYTHPQFPGKAFKDAKLLFKHMLVHGIPNKDVLGKRLARQFEWTVRLFAHVDLTAYAHAKSDSNRMQFISTTRIATDEAIQSILEKNYHLKINSDGRITRTGNKRMEDPPAPNLEELRKYLCRMGRTEGLDGRGGDPAEKLALDLWAATAPITSLTTKAERKKLEALVAASVTPKRVQSDHVTIKMKVNEEILPNGPVSSNVFASVSPGSSVVRKPYHFHSPFAAATMTVPTPASAAAAAAAASVPLYEPTETGYQETGSSTFTQANKKQRTDLHIDIHNTATTSHGDANFGESKDWDSVKEQVAVNIAEESDVPPHEPHSSAWMRETKTTDQQRTETDDTTTIAESHSEPPVAAARTMDASFFSVDSKPPPRLPAAAADENRLSWQQDDDTYHHYPTATGSTLQHEGKGTKTDRTENVDDSNKVPPANASMVSLSDNETLRSNLVQYNASSLFGTAASAAPAVAASAAAQGTKKTDRTETMSDEMSRQENKKPRNCEATTTRTNTTDQQSDRDGDTDSNVVWESARERIVEELLNFDHTILSDHARAVYVVLEGLVMDPNDSTAHLLNGITKTMQRLVRLGNKQPREIAEQIVGMFGLQCLRLSKGGSCESKK